MVFTRERTWRLIWRGALAFFIFWFLFWGVWEILGEVPITTTCGFSISRWWDVLFGPLWIPVFFLLAQRIEKNFKKEDEFEFDSDDQKWTVTVTLFLFVLLCLFIVCLIIGLFFSGLGFGLFLALICSLMIVLLISKPVRMLGRWLRARNNFSTR